jgi:hypothetical protein
MVKEGDGFIVVNLLKGEIGPPRDYSQAQSRPL